MSMTEQGGVNSSQGWNPTLGHSSAPTNSAQKNWLWGAPNRRCLAAQWQDQVGTDGRDSPLRTAALLVQLGAKPVLATPDAEEQVRGERMDLGLWEARRQQGLASTRLHLTNAVKNCVRKELWPGVRFLSEQDKSCDSVVARKVLKKSLQKDPTEQDCFSVVVVVVVDGEPLEGLIMGVTTSRFLLVHWSVPKTKLLSAAAGQLPQRRQLVFVVCQSSFWTFVSSFSPLLL